MSERRFLFLQGPLSPLFNRLGHRLKTEGYSVFRINFNVGDWLHWHGENCYSFRGKVEQWSEYLQQFIEDNAITDLVLHGDRRVYHKMAIHIAKQNDLYISVTELGILRPGWLTIERDGLGLLSHFPNEAQYLLDQAQHLPEPLKSKAYSYPFSQMAFWDVSYNLVNYFLFWIYPWYQRHTPYNPIQEYTFAALRLMGERRAQRQAKKVILKLRDSGAVYYVLPLQLNGDFQIRDYSPFDSMGDAIEMIMKSFARHAPPQSRLLIKQHPLDPGIDKLKAVTLNLAGRMNIKDRVDYIDGGNLDMAYQFSSGAVMVNSSAAVGALDQEVPVKTLAPAIYDIEGITFQGELDQFWQSGFKLNKNIYSAFKTILKHSTQIPGALYGKEALESAVEGMAEKIIDRRLNQPGGYVDVPPRLAGNEDWFNS